MAQLKLSHKYGSGLGVNSIHAENTETGQFENWFRFSGMMVWYLF